MSVKLFVEFNLALQWQTLHGAAERVAPKQQPRLANEIHGLAARAVLALGVQ
jgi:hypothetical protein